MFSFFSKKKKEEEKEKKSQQAEAKNGFEISFPARPTRRLRTREEHSGESV